LSSNSFLLPILVVCLCAEVASAQTLLRDINDSAPSSYASQLVYENGRLFFSTGPIWASDGTPEGTHELDEITGTHPRPVGRLNQWVFYRSRGTDSRMYRLWATDGVTTNALGEYDFPPSAAGITPRGLALEGGTAGHWVSDGTSIARVLWQGPRTSGSVYQGDGMAFYVSHWGPARTLQRADGTVAGTHQVDLGGIEPGREFGTFLGPTLLFVGRDETHGWEVWRVDSAGENLERLSDTLPELGPKGSITGFALAEDRAFIVVPGSDDRDQLFVSDGTRSGTRLIRQLPGVFSESFGGLIPGSGGVFFAVDDPSTGAELWHSDGTEAGTRLVADVAPGRSGSRPEGFLFDNGRLFFQADDGTSGPELWMSDGTRRGTELVVDLVPGPGGSKPGDTPGFSGPYDSVVSAGDGLFFVAFTHSDGHEIRYLDYATGSVHLVFDTGEGRAQPSWPSDLIRVGDVVVFQAKDGTFPLEFWRTDGTTEGTQPLRNILFTEEWWADRPWEIQAKALLFAGTHGLLAVDGTPNGFRPIFHGEDIREAVAADGSVVFSSGQDLFSTSGAWQAPALRIRGPGGGGTGEGHLLLGATGKNVVYVARDENGARRIWSTDGETAHILWNLDAGAGPRSSAERDGLLYFSMAEGELEGALMRTDGTAEGSEELWRGDGDLGVIQITPFRDGILFFNEGHRPYYWSEATGDAVVVAHTVAPFSSVFSGYQVVADKAYFPGSVPGVPASLWVTDGTVRGTREIADSLGTIRFLGEVEGQPVFSLEDELHGWEPWTTDDESVYMIGDLNPGPESSGPSQFVRLGDKVIFGANIPPYGSELWSLPVSRFVAPQPAEPEISTGLGVPYPNPGGGAVSLPLGAFGKREPVQVTAYDVLGRRHFVLHDGVMAAPTLRFSTTHWPAGLYLLRAESGSAVGHATLLVVH
jgi:ELWxxDGT repeat protein